MAGIIAYGDLWKLLESSEEVSITHNLESVKILPNSGDTPHEFWAEITSQAVSIAEINAPQRNESRIFCLAVMGKDSFGNGKPSSWSAMIDQISSKENGRLFIISAGNSENYTPYPENQYLTSALEPAQAWNAIAVGAYTELDKIQEVSYEGYKPLAKKGEISPHSTTSFTWDPEWPCKPDVIFEGGNVARKESIIGMPTELSLVSTWYKPDQGLFAEHCQTSAAAAKASWFAAQIKAKYNNYWPETIRGLMVHSANWPKELKSQIVGSSESKESFGNLLRICGYGVPDLTQALYCASNYLTIVTQQEIRPFKKNGNYIRLNEFHLLELPWPQEVLMDMPFNTPVSMRITLSYFIEPNPGERGWKSKYCYQSHALRFKVKLPTESTPDFLQSISREINGEETSTKLNHHESDFWKFGALQRNRGSIHSDIWEGTAQQLAKSNIIAVVPASGWWKTRTSLQKYDSLARYPLIVSVETPQEDIDIYTPVLNKVSVPISVEN